MASDWLSLIFLLFHQSALFSKMCLITACAHKRSSQAEELRETSLSALLSLAVNPDCSCRKQVEQDGIGSNSSHKNTGVILRPWSLWCDYCPALLVLSRWKQRGSAYQLLTCKTPSTLHCSETFDFDTITCSTGTGSSGNTCLGVVYPVQLDLSYLHNTQNKRVGFLCLYCPI